VVPSLENLSIYSWLITACMVVAFPRLIGQLSTRSMVANPINLGVAGLLVAVMLSHLPELYITGILGSGVEFTKVVIYYLLLVSLVDTPGRLRTFLALLVFFCVILTVLALLQFHGAIDIPSLRPVRDLEVESSTGSNFILLRLCSTGIFHDPNDLCLILILAMGLSVYRLANRNGGPFRILWLGPLLLFGYALTKTYSRGGLIAMLAAMTALFVSRFGVRRAIAPVLVGLLAAGVLFAGRQTSISATEDTGQQRIQLWAEGLALFRQSPLFGIGQNRYEERVGLVAHNSFIHAFTELGFGGGALFLGVFYYAIWSLHRLGRSEHLIRDPELRRFRPYLLAIVVGYCTALLALSRNYIVPTYLILALVTVYLRLATEGTSLRPPRLDARLAQRIGLISIIFVISAYLFVRTFARFGK
jgi:hypothetical protein